jgi:hypothetical protein
MQVRSMACGLLDSIYDAIHVFSENKLSSSPIPNTTTEVMEIEPPSKENTKCIAKGANQPGPSNLSLSFSFVSVVCTQSNSVIWNWNQPLTAAAPLDS